MSNKAFWNHRRQKFDRETRSLGEHMPEIPAEGFLRAVREAMGWSAESIGEKAGISGSGVLKLEQSEASKTISLKSLEQVANALNCDVHYVLIPRIPLSEQIYQRAIALAKKEILGSADADVVQVEEQEQIESRAKELMELHRQLWKETPER